MTELFYDPRDDKVCETRGLRTLYWLDDLGARPLSEARPDSAGFLFAGARDIEDYAALVAGRPVLRDRPEERAPLLQLDKVLDALAAASVSVPTARTWRLPADAPLPADLTFPLFLRTARTSWKLGGRAGRVNDADELRAEAAELRRALGWDAVILAREWLDLAPAGDAMYGPVPQEVRVWIKDGAPLAWSFHHLHAVPRPRGFPPSAADLRAISSMAAEVGRAFRSRLVVADFARLKAGGWVFIEAGPGSAAGTAHEAVFKAVAGRLMGCGSGFAGDDFGGPLAAMRKMERGQRG